MGFANTTLATGQNTLAKAFPGNKAGKYFSSRLFQVFLRGFVIAGFLPAYYRSCWNFCRSLICGVKVPMKRFTNIKIQFDIVYIFLAK